MTPKAQRIGILVIAIVMVAGTLGSFAMLILANDNITKEQDKAAKDYQAMVEEQQKEAKELSDTYYPIFKEYENRPAEFDAEAVGETVTTVDLKEGDGEVIADGSTYRVYYLGWDPKGKMFDSSFNGESLSAPLTHLADGMWEFPGGQTGNVIEGWPLGIDGMKVGGVRELTIPSDLAYGEAGSGDTIPPNTPLKFIIMVIPAAK